jgi:glycosyltransferase involved in cell wall biosynthesis
MSKKTVVIAGSVTTRSGYGAHARDIARALILSDKYDVSIIPIKWGSTPQDALDPDDADDKLILDRLVAPQLQAQPDVFIHLSIPNEFQRAGKFNIGITAGIETTACRAEWIEGCNRMDLVLATSEHSKKVFEITRFEKRDTATQQIVDVIQLTRPVEVLFEGIRPEIYNKKINPKSPIVKSLNEIPEDFCFLFVGHWLQGDLGQDRKDVGGLVRTFLESFKRKNSRNMPALVMKTSQAGFSVTERKVILDKLSDLRAMVRGAGWERELPPIYVLHGNLTDSEMNDLYNHKKIKAMVSFTKGEGFGRPLLEFTTTGKPVIASGWSGQLDFLHPDYSVVLRGQLTPVHESATNEWIVEGSQWFTVNYQLASQVMLDLHKRYDEYLKKSRKHRKYTMDNFSFDKMINKLCDYIDRVEDYSKLERKIPKAPQQTQLNLPKLSKTGNIQKPVTKKINLPKLKKV